MCLRARPISLIYALLLLLAHALSAQESQPGPVKLVLKSGTPVTLQFAKTISSARANQNDSLDFVVTRDVDVGGFTVIRAGTLAKGSVVGVKRKRPVGMGGDVIVEVASVELTTGQNIGLAARREFKGNSHTIRMGVVMAISAAIYLPSAPVFLLLRGPDRTVLKGTELTAYTTSDSLLDEAHLPVALEGASELPGMLELLPPRSLNSEGREGDMLNLMFVASEENLQDAFARAGWLKVEKSKPQIIWHLLLQRTHYAKLPMGRLYVFGRAPDFSYALPDPKSIVARRHHLRIWKTDRAVNGVPLWVGAATHDVAIEFVKGKFPLSHRIDPNVDAERDFIAANLAETHHLNREEYLRCSDPVYEARTATGQAYYSDSRMLLLELNGGIPTTVVATQVAGK
jgi:hypothetical protein